MDTNSQISTYQDQLSQLLRGNNVDDSQIQDALLTINQLITNSIAEEMVDNLNEHEQQELDKLQENNDSPESILSLLQLTEEDYKTRYTKKLEEYIQNFQQKFPELKTILQSLPVETEAKQV